DLLRARVGSHRAPARSLHRQHAHGAVGARGRLAAGRVRLAAAPAPGSAGVSATATLLRIGDVARLVGTTPRTIRYYEEKGLLPPAPGRPAGQHRVYEQADVERLREILRLKELL